MRMPVALPGIVAFALAATGCAGGDAARVPSPTHAADAAFIVASKSFDDGGTLPDSATANAFGGQCAGDNLNPELSWTGAPQGTVAYAITLIDVSANDFVHWTQADIPATATNIPAGGADALAGVGGHTGNSDGAYFGPCPPGADHRYVFTIYALDATLGLDANFGIGDLEAAMRGHVLAQGSITGIRSGPASTH